MSLFFVKQARKYNNLDTTNVGMLFTRGNITNKIFPREYFGGPQNIEFEGRTLLAPENIHEYLKSIFGSYMDLPEKEKRVGHEPVEVKL